MDRLGAREAADGAFSLWRDVANEDGKRSKDKKGFKVRYSQSMGKWGVKVGVRGDYYVRFGLNARRKQSVALAILINVSYDFEELQNSFPDRFPYKKVKDSGFSIEDLVSNVLGFYRAVKPRVDYFKALHPVSKQAALKIWDTYHPERYKNKRFGPYLYPCGECKGGPAGPMWAPLPQVLDTITPARMGTETLRPWIPSEDE